MKSILLAIILVFSISSFSFGQTEKGKFSIGGTLALSSKFKESETPNSESNNSVFGVSGSVGYFLVKNLSIGLNTGFVRDYSFEKSGAESDDRLTKNLAYGAFVKNYFGSKALKTFLSLGFSRGTSQSAVIRQNVIFNNVSKSDVLIRNFEQNISFGSGLAYFISEKCAIELDAFIIRSKILKQEIIWNHGQTLVGPSRTDTFDEFDPETSANLAIGISIFI